MPKSSWKSFLLGGLAFAMAIAGFAYLNSSLSEISDRLARCEDKLGQVDRTASKSAAKPAVVAAPAKTDASDALAEMDALRADVTQLKQRIAAVSTGTSAAPKNAAVVEETGPVAAGDTAAAFSPERTAAIKKVVEDTLTERDEARRKERAAQEEEQTRERRKRTLDELEQRLKLSAYQREQINTFLDERNKALEDLRGNMRGDSAPTGNRDDMRKKWQEAEQASEAKLKQLLTADQATEYEAWKKETGGFGGGGGRGPGGRGPGGDRPPGGGGPPNGSSGAAGS